MCTEQGKNPYPQNDYSVFDLDSFFFQFPIDYSSSYSLNPNPNPNPMEFDYSQLQFLDIFSNQTSTSGIPGDANLIKQTQDLNGEETNQQTRGRTSKKDRHTKINTARGPRDRRIRLSLEVARRFFDLQDLLGFEKASRTLDWLLKSSKIAIKELTKKLKTTHEENIDEEVAVTDKPVAAEHSGGKRNSKKKKPKVSCSSSRAVRVVDMESRRMARERARERTSQKKRRLLNLIYNQSDPNVYAETSSFNDIGFAFSFEDPRF